MAQQTQLLSWGNMAMGQLGHGKGMGTRTPYPVAGLVLSPGAEVAALSIGESHVLAVVDGRMLAWGNNSDRKLGTESSSNYYEVAAVSMPSEMPAVRAVAAGARHSACVTASGTAYTWGSGHRGALGLVKSWSNPKDFLSFKRKAPALISELSTQRLVTVAAGKGYCVALSESGVVWTWGSNRWGQCAISGGDQARPLRPRNLQNIGVSNIVAGPYHAMALTFGGGVYVWGRNDFGQLGLGNNTIAKNMEVVPRAWLVQTLFDAGVRVIGGAIGKYHSVFLSDAGQVYTCGMAGTGALGLKIGFFSKLMGRKQDLPKKVETLANVRIVQVAAGDEHTMALSESGDVYVWGSNKAGQLGVTTVRRSTSRPTVIDSLAGRARAVFAGAKVSMVRAVPSMSPSTTPVPGSLQHQASFVSVSPTPATPPVPAAPAQPAAPAAVEAPPSYEEALSEAPTEVKYPPVPSAPEKKLDGALAGAVAGGLATAGPSSSSSPVAVPSSSRRTSNSPTSRAAPATPPPPTTTTSTPMAPPPPSGAITPAPLQTSDPMEGTVDLVVELPSRPSLDSEAPMSDPEPPEQDAGPPLPPSSAPVVLQADYSTITPNADTPTGAMTPRSAPLGLPSPAILVVQAGEDTPTASPRDTSPSDLRSFADTSGWMSSPDNIARDLINQIVEEEASRIAGETLSEAVTRLESLPAVPDAEPQEGSGGAKKRSSADDAERVAVPGS